MAYSEYVYGDTTIGYWETEEATYIDEDCQNNGVSSGGGCAARVLEEGKMNY